MEPGADVLKTRTGNTGDMQMRRYTREHEWVEVSGSTAVIGITSHAAHELGDITFVELPEAETTCQQGDALGVIESVKAASDVYAPISGKISEVNTALEDAPESVNNSPEQEGWLFKLTDIDDSEVEKLMTEDQYKEFIG